MLRGARSHITWKPGIKMESGNSTPFRVYVFLAPGTCPNSEESGPAVRRGRWPVYRQQRAAS